MRILYFARFRQIIGRASDDLDLPPSVKTLHDLITHLSATDPACAAAFANPKTIRAAINQAHAQLDEPIQDATEIAFFPPVTGG